MRLKLLQGDCREILKMLEGCSVDSVVTDPPYELGFKGWDRSGIAYSVEVWEQCLRVLKPGGHLVAFGGSRTYHRLACAIEDTGFKIRDQIQWIYGSGFPKSLNLANGIGTGLKPAHEPIVLARKPLIGTVKANIAEWGTGGLRIEDCRIEGVLGNGHWSGDDGSDATSRPGYDGGFTKGGRARPLRISHGEDSPGKNTYGSSGPGGGSHAAGETTLGRWPANVIHDGSEEVLAAFPESDGQQGDLIGHSKDRLSKGIFGDMKAARNAIARNDSGSAARFFYCAKASKEDREEGLEMMPKWATSVGDERLSGQMNQRLHGIENRKTLSSTNHHPTVKPTTLMRYLCRLVTPPNGLVLDPFCGSGSTGKAAMLEGLQFIGIELNAEYYELAQRRIEAATRQGLLFTA